MVDPDVILKLQENSPILNNHPVNHDDVGRITFGDPGSVMGEGTGTTTPFTAFLDSSKQAGHVFRHKTNRPS